MSEDAAGRREGRGVVRWTGAALGASGVEGAGRPSSSISTSCSPSEEADDSSSEDGGASALGRGMGRALQSLEKASWSHPQLGQLGGEVGKQFEIDLSYPPLGQVGFWHL